MSTQEAIATTTSSPASPAVESGAAEAVSEATTTTKSVVGNEKTSEPSSSTASTANNTASGSEPLKIVHYGWLSKLPQSGTTSLNGLRYQARYFVQTEEFFGYSQKKIDVIHSEKDLSHAWKIKELLYADLEGNDHLKIIINSSDADKRTLILKGSNKSVESWLNKLRDVGVPSIPPAAANATAAANTSATSASADVTPPSSPKVEKPKKSSFGRVFASLSPSTASNQTPTSSPPASPAVESSETNVRATDSIASANATATASDDTQKKPTSPNPLQKAANWLTTSLKIPALSKPKEAAPTQATTTTTEAAAPAPATTEATETTTTEAAAAPVDQGAKDDSDQLAIGDKPAETASTTGQTSTIPEWPMATPVEREVEEPRHSRCASLFGGIFSFCVKESE